MKASPYTHGPVHTSAVHTDVHTERVHTRGTCGNTFTPTAAGQRYCPPTDEDKARVNGQARSQCATRAKNHAQRTREGRQTRPLNAPLPRLFTCGQCGNDCNSLKGTLSVLDAAREYHAMRRILHAP